MNIKVVISDKTLEPYKAEFKGCYALELMVIKLTEKYIGVKTSKMIENILKFKREE